MEVSLLYCSVGCSRTPHAVSWNENGVLAFAANRCVALAVKKTNALQVFETLHGHTDRINCVHWLTSRCRDEGNGPFKAKEEVLSGSVDNTIRVWSRTLPTERFSCVDELKGHTEPVTCVSGLYDPTSHDTHVISGSSDSTILVWNRPVVKDTFQNIQTLKFGRGLMMCADVFYLTPTKTTLLVCGGDDTLLHFYTRTAENSQYEKVLSLTGHEDWVRDVHIMQEDKGDILIASCSQDTYIRVWRMAQVKESSSSNGELKLEGNLLSISNGNQDGSSLVYSVTLETVLLGHDDWVYGVHWQPLIKGEGPTPSTQPLALLSVSMDKTMIIWEPDPDTGTWLDKVRMGDVGGNTLGLYGGVFGPDGDVIVAHGYQGAFHIWQRNQKDKTHWKPLTAPSGHFGPVQDISWEPSNGDYLISVSSDQTSRLHAPWNTPTNPDVTWHELSRPQVHGYDMQCVAMVTPSVFVSGADEKVLRVFAAPQNFFQTLSNISGYSLKGDPHQLDPTAAPLGASVPSLGLSNKAVFTDTATEPQEKEAITKNPFADHIPSFSSIELKEPPLEEHLLQNTLWPESQKLYGHGYELYCVACSADGQLVASACKASKAEYAAVRVWNTTTWSQVAMLTHHSLTVTQMEFSNDSSKLLVVSRDRSWSLWNRNKDGNKLFTLTAQVDKSLKAHSRIIWSCSWSHDDRFFATASRDKRVCIWCQSEGSSNGWGLAATPFEASQPATAVDFAPQCAITQTSKYLLAVGTEFGEIILMSFNPADHNCSLMSKLLCHSLVIRRLKWRPHPQSLNKDNRKLVLASCSNDWCLKLFTIHLS